MARLKELEAAHPEFDAPDSPTRRVGGAVGSDFKPVKHAVPMLSLDNAYEEADIRAWGERVRKNLPPGDAPPTGRAEDRRPVLRADLRGRRLRPRRDARRRRDRRGRDRERAHAAARSRCVCPRRAEALELRGEVYMTFADFEKVTRTRPPPAGSRS